MLSFFEGTEAVYPATPLRRAGENSRYVRIEKIRELVDYEHFWVFSIKRLQSFGLSIKSGDYT